MANLDGLRKAYGSYVRLEWRRNLSGAERCMFLLYNPDHERELRMQIGEFELATRQAGHQWLPCDVTDAFARWMGAHPYAGAYFEEPELLESALEGFAEFTAARVREVLDQSDDNTVVAIVGVASLFGFLSVSRLLTDVEDRIRGRLAVFFPGTHQDAQYALLGVPHGWNYHAVPIKPSELSLS